MNQTDMLLYRGAISLLSKVESLFKVEIFCCSCPCEGKVYYFQVSKTKRLSVINQAFSPLKLTNKIVEEVIFYHNLL